MNLTEAHNLWATADHDAYTEGWERTHYLVSLVMKYVPHVNRSILEIGCNVGRNLNGLLKANYKDLTGVDINPNTEKHRKEHYPRLVEVGRFAYCSLEDLFLKETGLTFDLVFTMAVLEHIHPNSEWAINNIPDLLNPGGYLITIEDELNEDGLNYVFARNYENRFPGLKQIHAEDASHIPGLKKGYITRVFKRPLR